MSVPPEGVQAARSVPSEEESRRQSVRLHLPDGSVSAGQLAVLSEVARRYGMGFVQIGARKRVEIPGVAYADLHAVRTALAAAGIGVATAGGNRAVHICAKPGGCPNAFVDVRPLAAAITDLIEADAYPGPIRVGIACCHRMCTAPQTADIGFVGTVDPILNRAECRTCGLCATACDEGALIMRRGLPRRDPMKCTYCGMCIVACTPGALKPGKIGYTVYVGGKAGTRPQYGTVVARFLPGEEAPEFTARLLAFLGERAHPREQIASVLRRVGLDALRVHLAVRLGQRPRAREAIT